MAGFGMEWIAYCKYSFERQRSYPLGASFRSCFFVCASMASSSAAEGMTTRIARL